MSTETRRPKRSDLRPQDFIAWPNEDRTEVQQVQRTHRNGVILRDQFGYVDQHDGLPPRWRIATEAEIAEYRGVSR